MKEIDDPSDFDLSQAIDEATQRRVLIVDDDVDFADSLHDILEVENYQVEIACNAAKALTTVEVFAPHVVLLDIRLGQANGIDLLAVLKQKHPPLLCIIMTAYADVETAIKALQSDAYDYLRKPLYPQELAATLHRCFEKISLEQENRLALTALRASEKRYRSIFENALEGIFRSTPQGKFTDVNPALVRMLGYQATAEILALNLQENLYIEPSYQNYIEILHQAQGVVKDLELTWEKKDGARLIVSLNCQAIYDDQGQILFYEGMTQDITEHKRAGELEEQYRQAQKMEAIGRLAGGMAHDFNNLLTVITGYSELLLHRYLDNNDPLRKDIEQIHKAGERAASLTRQLLAFSRQQVIQPKVLDLNALITDLNKMLRRLVSEDIDLITTLDPTLGRIKADPGQIEQIIMNLTVNACDAMPQGGQLTIMTSNSAINADSGEWPIGLAPGAYALLTVSDTGVGMNPETLSHIFEPFFTTKEMGKGTGLGLATVYGIVQQNKGHVSVSSQPGQGAAFKIYLPQIEQVIQPAKEEQGAVESPRGSETILLVEDEKTVRELARQALRQSGYQVLEARHGQDALKICQQHNGPIHLLLTDVVMPSGLSGHDLAQQLVARHPETKVLYMSGYVDETIVQHGILEPGVAFLHKPFSLAGLSFKVRTVLDS